MAYYNPFNFGLGAAPQRHRSYSPFATHAPPAAASPTFNFFNAEQAAPRHQAAQATGYADTWDPFARLFLEAAQSRQQDDLDAEEAAALAHLEAIQARRRQQQAAADAERQRAAEAERQKQLARARWEEEAKRAREQAIAESLRRELAEARNRHIQAQQQEQRRRHAERQAAETRAHLEAVHRHNQAAESARKRLIEAQQERLRQHADINAARKAQWEAIVKGKAEHAARCAAKCAAQYTKPAVKEQVKNHDKELEKLNGLLGMFGIQIKEEKDDEKEKEVAKQEEVEPVEKNEEINEKALPAPATAPSSNQDKSATATSTDSKTAQEHGFPDAINEILSQFLGLRVEPVSESTSSPSAESATGKGGVPEGLNEILGQLGLVFEPETADAPAAEASTESAAPLPESVPASTADAMTAPTPAEASSSKAAPRPMEEYVPKTVPSIEDTPLTAFLNGVSDLPPFVRDILGNVEMAWKEKSEQKAPASAACARKEGCCGRKNKGKGVDRSNWPAPVPAPAAPLAAAVSTTQPEPTPRESTASTESGSSASLDKLSSIDSEIDLVRDSFTFPSRLTFGPSTTADETSASPNLLFNKTNSGYHAQANKLLQLLLQADGVPSEGDKTVRARRKQVVKKVEHEISLLEKKRDEVWEEVRVKRESGELSDDEEETVSTGSTPSVIDNEEVREEPEHVEHVEDATSKEITEATLPAPESEAAKPKVESEAVQGFEVPADPTEVVKPVEVKENVTEVKEEKEAKEQKQDDEYEFIE